MKQILLAVLITGMVIACGGEASTSADALATKNDSKEKIPADGEKIFKQYCVTCHGLYGDMGLAGAANLTISALSVEERMVVITQGRNTMTPFSPLLNEEKIKAVAEYTLQLKNRKE